MEFNKRLAYALTCRSLGKFQKASDLLDELANALLYKENHPEKSLDDCLFITKSFKKFGRENAALLAAGVRFDRESHFTINYKQELLELLPAPVTTDDNTILIDKIFSLIAVIRNNKKILSALQKNCSAQYINRIMKKDKNLSSLHAAKLKKFYQLYNKLF